MVEIRCYPRADYYYQIYTLLSFYFFFYFNRLFCNRDSNERVGRQFEYGGYFQNEQPVSEKWAFFVWNATSSGTALVLNLDEVEGPSFSTKVS